MILEALALNLGVLIGEFLASPFYKREVRLHLILFHLTLVLILIYLISLNVKLEIGKETKIKDLALLFSIGLMSTIVSGFAVFGTEINLKKIFSKRKVNIERLARIYKTLLSKGINAEEVFKSAGLKEEMKIIKNIT